MGEKKANFLKILCSDQHLNLAIRGLLIQGKWKIVTFDEEHDLLSGRWQGAPDLVGLNPEGGLF